MASAKAKGIVSSIPTRPVARRSRRMEATSSDGLSCSSQARTSPPMRICSSARAFSKAGVTQAGSPSTVSTAPNIRSLRPHSAPVKYSRLVPEAITIASRPASAHQGLRAREAGPALVEADGKDARHHGPECGESGGDGRWGGGSLRARGPRNQRPRHRSAAEMEEIAPGERHGGYGTLVRSWVAAPTGCWSQHFSSWPARRRRMRRPSLPTCTSAACPRRASPSISTRGWSRWPGAPPPSPPRSSSGTRRATASHVGRVNIVLADVEDDPNGFATPLPVSAGEPARGGAGRQRRTSATTTTGCASSSPTSWPTSCISRRRMAWCRAGRKVLGRAPFLFPNAATPTWMMEGLATYEETQGTAFGRGRNPDVADGRCAWPPWRGTFLPRTSRSAGLERWPGGQASYLFGRGVPEGPLRARRALRPARSGPRARRPPHSVPRRAHRAQGHRRDLPRAVDAVAGQPAGGVRAGGGGHPVARADRLARAHHARRAPDPGRASAPTALGSPTPIATSRTSARSASSGARAAGTHEVVKRNGGTFLAWTPDGRGPGLRRAGELPPLPGDLGPARRRPRHAQGALDHARPARARPRRLLGRRAASSSCGRAPIAATWPSPSSAAERSAT